MIKVKKFEISKTRSNEKNRISIYKTKLYIAM